MKKVSSLQLPLSVRLNRFFYFLHCNYFWHQWPFEKFICINFNQIFNSRTRMPHCNSFVYQIVIVIVILLLFPFLLLPLLLLLFSPIIGPGQGSGSLASNTWQSCSEAAAAAAAAAARHHQTAASSLTSDCTSQYLGGRIGNPFQSQVSWSIRSETQLL